MWHSWNPASGVLLVLLVALGAANVQGQVINKKILTNIKTVTQLTSSPTLASSPKRTVVLPPFNVASPLVLQTTPTVPSVPEPAPSNSGPPVSSCPEAKGFVAYVGVEHVGDTLAPISRGTSLKAAAKACRKDYRCRGFSFSPSSQAGEYKKATSPVAISASVCQYVLQSELPEGVTRKSTITRPCVSLSAGIWNLRFTQEPYDAPNASPSYTPLGNRTAYRVGANSCPQQINFRVAQDCVKLETCLRLTGTYYQRCGLPPSASSAPGLSCAIIPGDRLEELLDEQKQNPSSLTCPICVYRFDKELNTWVKECCPDKKPKCCGSSCCKESEGCCGGECLPKGGTCCNGLQPCGPKNECCGFGCCKKSEKCCGNNYCVPKSEDCN